MIGAPDRQPNETPRGVRCWLLVASVVASSAWPCLAENLLSLSHQSDGSAASEKRAAILKGRSVSEALLSLQRRGLSIVFSSELVRPEMTVLVEPSAENPRLILDEILAPHGLQVREGAEGVLVVVPKMGTNDQLASIQGTVFDRGSGRGLTEAVVRVVEVGLAARVLADGSFSISTPAPATYTVQATAPGYLDRVANVSVRPGSSQKVIFRLHPQLYIEDAIVVQPSRLSLLLEEPDSSFSLSREEIESLPHLGGDIFRTTSLLPGVAAGDVTAELSVHGGRRDEVRILLDGQEIYGTYHLEDYDSALSIVHAETLAGATLTTGAYPASQGDRMSGIFDLRTVDPVPGRHFVISVSVLDMLVSGSGRFAQERGSWLFAARRGSIDLARDLIGDEDPRFWDAFGRVEHPIGDSSIIARILLANDTLDVNTVEVDGFERVANEYRNSYGWLTHQTGSGHRYVVETIGSWTRLETNRDGIGDDEQISYELADRRELDVTGISQTWTLPLGERHLARWGGEARRYDAYFDYSKTLDPNFVVAAPFSTPRIFEHEFEGSLRGDHVALWASDRISLFDRMTAELGLRYDHHTATEDKLLSPRVNLGWRVGDQSVLRAAWGRFFQSQRPYELQVEDGESGLRPAELSQHVVVGYEKYFRLERLGVEALRLELFRREIDDPRPRYENLLEPLNFFPETEPDRVRIAPERSIAQGVEVLLRGSGGERVDWWMAYSYARAEDQIAGRDVPRSLDQPHTATLDVHFRLPKQWDLNLAWRYRTGWPTTPVEAGEIDDPDEPGEPTVAAIFGPLNSERFPDYHRLDLRASRRWETRSGSVTFFVDVQNVYNRSNLSGFDLSFGEDTGALELEPEYWPQTFPSFGITLEF